MKVERFGYRHYVLVMLTLVYVFNFIDRQLLVILQESIKTELHLSDTQLGLLSGFTFAIFYITLGIPIARLADKGNRKNIVVISLGLWSFMTTFSGLARNFFQLLLARIGVGVGEAGGSPSAHAIISDYFPPEKRSTALSVYSTGIYLGMLMGFIMGGFLNDHLGWRNAFYTLGIPGVIFSAIVYFTVKEPRKGATDKKCIEDQDAPSLKAVLHYLYDTRVFIYLALGCGLNVFGIYGLLNWMPSYLIRIFGMQTSQIGVYLGLIFGIGGGLGTFFGGYITDYFGKTDKKWYLIIPALAIMISAFSVAATFTFKNTYVMFFCLGVSTFLQSTYLGPAISVAHSLVPANMRALTSAILFFVLNLIGLGLGPLTVGIISDRLQPLFGSESLRWALYTITPVSICSSLIFYKTSEKLRLNAEA
ncbi:MAG TPA: MFS transporter [Bacteroidales bacterium]|nr:MFS transporter [Bacteroidales bacterium]